MELQPPDILKTPLNVQYVTLMGPGPVNPSQRVLNAMSNPVISPVHPQLFQIMKEVTAGLQYIFKTNNETTMCVSGTGHAGMETSLCNLIEDNTVVLVGVIGYWGLQAANMARRHGAKELHEVRAPLGEALTLDQVRAALDEYEPNIFLTVHGDSTSGVVQPNLREFGELCRQRDCIFVVDTVASLGGEEFYMDDWFIDVAFSGSQKVISMPPGLAPISLNERAMQRIRERKTKVDVYYMDVILMANHWRCYGNSSIYHHTIPSSLVVAMREALAELCEEGTSASWRRHAECTQRLHNGLEKMGFQFFVTHPEHRLKTVTTVKVPEGIDCERIKEYAMKNYSLEFAGALGIAHGTLLRFGVMGYNAKPEKIDFLLKVIDEAIKNHRQDAIIL